MNRVVKIAIVAGEASGDMLGGRLINAIKTELTTSNPSVTIQLMGVGGDNLIKCGLQPMFPMKVLSIGGYGLDVLTAIPKILYLRHKLINQIIKFKPDMFIGVDAPDFNLTVEEKLKQNGIKTIHYISPTIWAWRYNRIFKIKHAVDLMLCAFPMEEEIYSKENVKAKFVGHHLADEIPLKVLKKADRSKYFDSLSCSTLPTNNGAIKHVVFDNVDSKIFCVLLGSRVSELNHFGETLLNACSVINEQISDALFLFPLINQQTYDLLIDKLKNLQVKFNYRIIMNQTREAICASNLVLAKSGTVTLEVALCKKPMVISYKVSKFTAWVIRKKIQIPYVALPNILLNEEVAKEILQEEATASNIANEFIGLYNDKKRQQYMVDKFSQLHSTLKKGASTTAAQYCIDSFIEQ